MTPAPKWYRRKNYPHFDLPLSWQRAEKLASNPLKVSKHPFFPFLYFEIATRKFGGVKKIRPIRYASHRDSYIYAYYAEKLAERYETFLHQTDLGESVLAYRAGIGNNVDFAKEAFQQISALGNCVAIGFDIEKFFDNLDHKLLQHRWQTLIGCTRLPDDHFALFKSLTRFSSVDKELCYRTLKIHKKLRKLTRPICSPRDFRQKIRGCSFEGKALLEVNKTRKGIPQGSSMSAVLANLYLSEFDLQMLQFAKLIGGVYRRYSDDILFVVPPPYELATKTLVADELKKALLNINAKKTTVSRFFKCSAGHISLFPGDKPFQYLGFVFDGERILLRSQTLSNYWRKVRKAIKRVRGHAARALRLKRNNTVFKKKILERYTHHGKRNFVSYAKGAAIVMVGFNTRKTSPIWKQIKKHDLRINRALR